MVVESRRVGRCVVEDPPFSSGFNMRKGRMFVNTGLRTFPLTNFRGSGNVVVRPSIFLFKNSPHTAPCSTPP